MKKLTILLLACSSLAPIGCHAQQVPTAKVTVEVVDISGEAINGAFIGVGGGLSTPENGPVPSSVNGTTNIQGKFMAEVASAREEYGAFARANGYYEGSAKQKKSWRTQADFDMAYQTGKWSPWEREIKVVLRPIKKPVPMYVRAVEAQLPAPGAWVGYDLEVGDWVAPHGNGKISDVEFKGSGEWNDWRNYDTTLTMRFPGKGNGIQLIKSPEYDYHSAFSMPYEASEEGYQPEYAWRSYQKQGATKNDPDKQGNNIDVKARHIIRVRTILDENGRIKEAWYGRLQNVEHMDVGKEGRATMSFIYYLNPDGTRNLEYNPKKNLCPLPKGQRYQPREFGP